MNSRSNQPMSEGRATILSAPELKGARIAVVGGGLPHRVLAWPVIEKITRVLGGLGYDATIVDAERSDFVRTIVKFDVAYLAHFGLRSDDGVLQGLLAALNIPYTGSGTSATALAQHKVVSKILMRASGLRTPDFIVLDSSVNLTDQISRALSAFGRMVLKPVFGGGSYGIAITNDVKTTVAALPEAMEYGPVFLEKFVEGRTLTSGVVGVGRSRLVLPAHEVRFDNDAPFLKPATLFSEGSSEIIFPPRVAAWSAREVEIMSERAHEVLAARGVSRSDFRVDGEGRPWILELNTLPGMSALSDLPVAAAHAGLSFPQLVDAILMSAVGRPWYVP